VRSSGVKCHQKIALVGRLYWQYRTPSVDCPADVLDRYPRFKDRHLTELRKGLQQQGARRRPHRPGDEVTRGDNPVVMPFRPV